MDGGMGTSFARGAVVEWARDIYDDLDFTVVRRWLEEHPQGKAGGYLPVYAPREVLHATGFLPVGIHGGGDRLEIIRGDAFYQSYICHLPRSVIELAQSGRLDMLSAVLFPSTCDVIRHLSGTWTCRRFPIRAPRRSSGRASSAGCSTTSATSPETGRPTRSCAARSRCTTKRAR